MRLKRNEVKGRDEGKIEKALGEGEIKEG